MRWQGITIFIVALTLTSWSEVPKPKPIPTGSLEKFQARAAKFNEVVTVPVFETTPDEIAATANKIIADGNAALDRIGAVKPGEVNFTNTILALDNMSYEIDQPARRLGLIEQTSTATFARVSLPVFEFRINSILLPSASVANSSPLRFSIPISMSSAFALSMSRG